MLELEKQKVEMEKMRKKAEMENQRYAILDRALKDAQHKERNERQIASKKRTETLSRLQTLISEINLQGQDDESFEFVMDEIESIFFDENRLWKNDKVITKFKKIFPEFEKFKKDFKLFIFSFYFDEDPHSVYRGEIEFYKRHFG